MKINKLCLFASLVVFTEFLVASENNWKYWGGDHSFQRYSAAEQINSDNVSSLEIAWRRPAVDLSITEAYPNLRISRNLRATPIFINGVLYSSNGVGLVEAFNPATGDTLWVQRPDENTFEQLQGQSSRGVEYWTDGSTERLFVIRKGFLYALEIDSGQLISSFGERGKINLVPESSANFNYLSGGPIIVNDVIVVAGTIDGAGDSGAKWRGVASENVRGYDVLSGELLWTFYAVPREGEFGYDTWANDSARDSGDLGAWCCLSADPALGMVYIPFTAPTAAYYGGHRGGDNLFSNSLVALDVESGERVWHFQMVHHDVWEYDNVGPPVLGNIMVDNQPIRAVMQANKTGWIYVFDRATGEPVWPIEEIAVPQSGVPGEKLSATQPFPTKPPPIATQGITPADIIDFPEVSQIARAEAANFVIGPIFTPPTIVSSEPGGTQGTLTLPGSWGSANWNTGAFDPETGYYFGFANDIPRVYRLERAAQEDAEMDYWSPNREAPYIDGIPLTKPPWGRITAIDMNRGEHVWQVANGSSLSGHPSIVNLNLQSLGIASRPVALVTKSLLFIGEGSNLHGGTMPNMWGTKFRAYDKATGQVLAEIELPSGTTGGPMSYVHNEKQYIVVTVGSYGDPAEFVALALP